jgi:hypothetical protein
MSHPRRQYLVLLMVTAGHCHEKLKPDSVELILQKTGRVLLFDKKRLRHG